MNRRSLYDSLRGNPWSALPPEGANDRVWHNGDLHAGSRCKRRSADRGASTVIAEPFGKNSADGNHYFQRYEELVLPGRGKPSRHMAVSTWNFASTRIFASHNGASAARGDPFFEHHARQYCRLIQLRDY
jgi:hypothetical protein